MIYIRAWYLESEQQPPPADVLPALSMEYDEVGDSVPETEEDCPRFIMSH